MPQMKVCGIKNAAIAQMVEHVIGNDEVSSSNLLSSSKTDIRSDVRFSLPCAILDFSDVPLYATEKEPYTGRQAL